MNCFRFAPILILLGGTALAQTTPPAADAKPAPPAAVKSFDLTAIDKTADPCTDFYQYACGNWVKSNPIPGDQVRWARSFSLLGERNRYLLWQELDAAAASPTSALEKQYGNYFAACMNQDLVEQKGLKPLEPALQRIAALKDTHKLATLMGELAAREVRRRCSASAWNRTTRTLPSRSHPSTRAASHCPTAITILWTTSASSRFASSTSSM